MEIEIAVPQQGKFEQEIEVPAAEAAPRESVIHVYPFYAF